DTDAQWGLFFGRGVPVGPKHGECIRTAVFAPDSLAPTMSNVEAMHGALFDLDEDEAIAALRAAAAQGPYGDTDYGRLALIWQRLEYRRIIVWSTYNHRSDAPRYRLLVPFARPVEPSAFRWVW